MSFFPPRQSRISRADNLEVPVIDLLRPHLRTGQCLIVTGFQDMLSSLSIIMDELSSEFRDPTVLPRPKIHLVYGMDTAIRENFPGVRSVPQAVSQHFMSQFGLKVDNASDLKAAMAVGAIERNEINIRVFDTTLAKQKLKWNGRGRMHAKVISSDLGVIQGSANFSYSGLRHNIESVDDLRYDSRSKDVVVAAEERAEFAKKIYDVSVDCTKEVLDILNSLLRTVSPEDAISRCVAEQTGFPYWRSDLLDNYKLSSAKTLFPYQSDLVYRAAGTVYEHGVAFVCAPAGSGKTPVGKYLAHVLPETYKRIIPDGSAGNIDRGGTMVISPPRIAKRWKKNNRRYKVLSHTELAKNHNVLEQTAVHVVDESHRVAPGPANISQRAETMEATPPAWTVFLSATQLGNRDVDSLIHYQENRASLFMPNDFVDKIREISNESRGLWNTDPDMLDVILGPLLNDNRLEEIREKLVDLVSPCVVLCSRDDIGIRTKKTAGDIGLYPVINNHGRHSAIQITGRQQSAVEEIAKGLADITGDTPKFVQKYSRFGELDRRPVRDSALHARNLMSILRMNPLVARYEMMHGKIGENLRRIETNLRHKKQPPLGQLEIFTEFDPKLKQTPKCDDLAKRLQSNVMKVLHNKCVKALMDIQFKHNRVVFLAERVLPLLVYAEILAQKGCHDKVHVIASKQEDVGGASERSALLSILNVTKPSYTRSGRGDVIEEMFSENGNSRTHGSVSVFMTYQMAEGVNMQSCDTLVSISVASSMVYLIQGLGRIDRIDSPVDEIHYYLVDIPTSPLTSDHNAAERLKVNRSLTARQQQPPPSGEMEKEDITERNFDNALNFIQDARTPRQNNYYDILSEIQNKLDQTVYIKVADLIKKQVRIEGLWGAELAVLPGSGNTTIFHLKGEGGTKAGDMATPRLLAIYEDELERNQIRCARLLRDAYAQTMRRGLHTASPTVEAKELAINQLVHHLPMLKEWDLRPERMLAPLESLAKALRPEESHDEQLTEKLFGQLSLQALEQLVEGWTRLLNPYWKEEKKHVRKKIKKGQISDYASCDVVASKAMENIEDAENLRNEMYQLYKQQLVHNLQDPSRVISRIAVAFVSAQL
ncbi:MAG: hypothetical protein OXG94_05645 [Bacteroidetes bacterium]|nr:hypothetical protein [Bacteroidota bacterium]